MGMSFPWEKVESSNVAAFKYDSDSRTLYTKFKNGSVYEYDDVPESVGAASRFQESPGKYIWQVMRKNGYAYKQIKQKTK